MTNTLDKNAVAATQAAAAPWKRSALVPTIATIAFVALCVAAGNWQRDRMVEKEALRARFDAASAAAPVPLPRNVVDWNDWRYRQVVANGRFDARRQILLDNKVHRGIVGFEVVTPLTLDDGRIVLVDRGFVAAPASRQTLPEALPAAGEVIARGRVNIPSSTYFELGAAQPGTAWQHLDLKRYAQSTGLSILPIVIEATAATGGDESLVRDWPAPDFGIERHRIYMVQWYTFATMAVALWLWFVARRRLFK